MEDVVIKELKLKLELHLLEAHGLYHAGYISYKELLHVHYLEHHPNPECASLAC